VTSNNTHKNIIVVQYTYTKAKELIKTR
jgi:hypothetical protein